MAPATTRSLPVLTTYGSAHDLPGLPPGFTDTFESYLVDANGTRQHAVVGGTGRPLLLLGGCGAGGGSAEVTCEGDRCRAVVTGTPVEVSEPAPSTRSSVRAP